jgi:hypothetical protein
MTASCYEIDSSCSETVVRLKVLNIIAGEKWRLQVFDTCTTTTSSSLKRSTHLIHKRKVQVAQDIPRILLQVHRHVVPRERIPREPVRQFHNRRVSTRHRRDCEGSRPLIVVTFGFLRGRGGGVIVLKESGGADRGGDVAEFLRNGESREEAEG